MNAIASAGMVTAAAPANPPAAPPAQSADKAPSGSWTIVPGLLEVKWDYDVTKNEVDVKVMFLWWPIDSLTGKLSNTQLSFEDTIDLLGLVKGKLHVWAVFKTTTNGDAPGLWIFGDLDVFSKEWKFTNRLLSW